MQYKELNADKLKLLKIGSCNENDFVKVIWTTSVQEAIDILGSGGTFTLALTNANGTSSVEVSYSENRLEWVVGSENLVKGYGTCQWTYTVGERVKKSKKYTVQVNDSLVIPTPSNEEAE